MSSDAQKAALVIVAIFLSCIAVLGAIACRFVRLGW